MLYDPKWETVVDHDFEKAADYIEQHGWCQGTAIDHCGRVCMVGSMVKSAGRSVEARLAQLWHVMGESPMAFNDATGRTKEEVVGVLRRLARGLPWRAEK